ncbi:uncharacterized protein LOC100005599 [Danio rerio]|uniref:Uncharacterized protein LOC100005599 n=1 Tax=Danio rerio TaxID=7955 RepID=B3DHA8_DANRE|nr:uncharacterized protein LOC100005599 [Danio rerio]AAI62698.1 Hypothetical protein LOC100005599 [Danio rerio]AAI62713.1 Hypothetical protein LOC100005599 [Danio rerio]|eukprot:NP_001129457.1 uncharacterized protein LOC100005599 [Danio rerio]
MAIVVNQKLVWRFPPRSFNYWWYTDGWYVWAKADKMLAQYQPKKVSFADESCLNQHEEELYALQTSLSPPQRSVHRYSDPYSPSERPSEPFTWRDQVKARQKTHVRSRRKIACSWLARVARFFLKPFRKTRAESPDSDRGPEEQETCAASQATPRPARKHVQWPDTDRSCFHYRPKFTGSLRERFRWRENRKLNQEENIHMRAGIFFPRGPGLISRTFTSLKISVLTSLHLYPPPASRMKSCLKTRTDEASSSSATAGARFISTLEVQLN